MIESRSISNQTRSRYIDEVIRRLLDIVIAGGGLILLAPLFLVIAILVKWGDGGPIFYRAQRVGQHGRLFRLFKFRSMVPTADRQGAGITTHGDLRITRIGHLLRKTKLDELPQLLNVLRGEMSLVGPRPEDPRYVVFYSADDRQLLAIRPGITSVASLLYRDEAAHLTGPDWETVYIKQMLPAKLALERTYLQRRRWWTDVGILFQTAAAIVRRPKMQKPVGPR